MKRTLFICAALLAACSSSAPEPDPAPVENEVATAPAAPQNVCPIPGAEPVAIAMPTTSGEPLMVNGLEYDRIWNADLNEDGMPDMILQQRGACNMNDECVDTVWLGCTPQSFVAVWGPEPAYELYVLEETHEYEGVTWRTLERLTVDAAGETEKETLHFTGTAYEPVK